MRLPPTSASGCPRRVGPSSPSDENIIYHLATVHEDYIGRTLLKHKTGPSVGGMTQRWEQHMRQFKYHYLGTAKNQRSRYRILLKGAGKLSSVFLRGTWPKKKLLSEKNRFTLSPRARLPITSCGPLVLLSRGCLDLQLLRGVMVRKNNGSAGL